MTRLKIRARWGLVLAATLGITFAWPTVTPAQSTVQPRSMTGEFDLLADGPKPFVLAGEASVRGKYTAFGEVEFGPGEAEGSVVGAGPIVFRAENGDLLVGDANWEFGPPDRGVRVTQLSIVWRNAVRFSDGTTVASTGQFGENRVAGLVPDFIAPNWAGRVIVGLVSAAVVIVETVSKL